MAMQLWEKGRMRPGGTSFQRPSVLSLHRDNHLRHANMLLVLVSLCTHLGDMARRRRQLDEQQFLGGVEHTVLDHLRRRQSAVTLLALYLATGQVAGKRRHAGASTAGGGRKGQSVLIGLWPGK